VTGWLVLGGALAVLLGGALLLAKVKPYKACPVCNGRGHCVRCQYTGKVLRFGARWVHPELKREKR
jgi:hypothetical protein